MKVLIVGITGMIGSSLATYLIEQEYTVFGIARPSSSARKHIVDNQAIKFCDIQDEKLLENVFQDVQPDLVIHLAAQAFNGSSWSMEYLTHYMNIFGTLNVLHCCQKVCPNAKVILACSSAEYGYISNEEELIGEERLLTPISPYGVSKVAVECLGYQYFKNYNIQVFLPRLFIHVGPGHPPATAIQNFARQLALIKKGKREAVLKVGRLDTARDFVDVRDGVKAIMILQDKGNPGEPYNICSGKAHTIQWILDKLIEISDLDVQVIQDRNLLRPSDEKVLVGDPSKIQKLGWHPSFSMEQTLRDVYQDWLSRV